MQRALLIVAIIAGIILFGSYLGNKKLTTPPSAATAEANLQPTAGQREAPIEQAKPTSERLSRIVTRPLDAGQYTHVLLAGLTNVDTSTGRLSQEQMAQVRQSFQALVAQGPAAIPSIRGILDQKIDLNYGKGSGDSIGAPSLRTGLLETLRQIGGPEAIATSRQVLQTSSDPIEIALLTRNLEEASPGQYRQDSLDATLAALNAAAQGQMTNSDVGPLFQTLQTFGDTNAIGNLNALAPKYGYYVSLALAGLPSGAGVSALTQMAQDTSEAGTRNQQFALQMLAQTSASYPEAGTALVNMARSGQIPDNAWNALADVLAGQQFQFTRQYPNNMFATPDGQDLRTYRQQDGNQNFLSSTLSGDALNLNQRIALIDQLVASTSDPAALQALQQARSRLSGAGHR